MSEADVWLFQIILTALAPFADLLLVWQLIGQGIAYLQHGAEFSNDNLVIVGIYYAVFMVVDLAAALIGFLMEQREDWTLLWWLVLQRFGYRQLMYYVVVRSIVTAIKGLTFRPTGEIDIVERIPRELQCQQVVLQRIKLQFGLELGLVPARDLPMG